METWGDLLELVVKASRARKAAQAEEDRLKDQLILAYKLSQPETNLFRVGDARVIVKQKSDLRIHKPDELLAILGARAKETLKPNQKLVWAILSKEPSMMAKSMAQGAVSVSLTTYVEVNLGGEQSGTSEAIEDRPAPIQPTVEDSPVVGTPKDTAH